MITPLQLPNDLAEYSRMRHALWPDCSEEIHQLEISQQTTEKNATVFVFRRENGRPGAFIELSVRDRVDGSTSEKVGHIEGWYVDEDLRARGRQLVARAEDWARAQGLTEMASDAEIDNEGSIQAHTSLGYRETFCLVHFLKELTKD